MSTSLILLLPRREPGSAAAARTCRWLLADGTSGEGSLEQAALACAKLRASVDLVLPASDAVLASVSLTRRQAKHIRKVLPYLLEDRLLDAPEELWFAHGKPSGQSYPVLGCRRDELDQYLALVAEAGAGLRGVWVDADLLANEHGALLATYDENDSLWLRDREQSLVASAKDIAELRATQGQEADEGLTELDSQTFIDQLRAALGRVPPTGLNLLYGELRPRAPQQQAGGGWQNDWLPVARFAALVLVAVWLFTWLQKLSYEQAARDAQQRVASMYEQLFPDDRAVAVERQLRQRLSVMGAGGGGQDFLSLVAPLGQSLSSNGSELELRRIQYDETDGIVHIDVRASDFESLEAIRDRIQAGGLAAEITEGRSQGDRVTARLRVRSADAS